MTIEGGLTNTIVREEQDTILGGPPRRHSRRLEDKLLVAFHHACDVHELMVADTLLRMLETMMARQSEGDHHRRRIMESVVAAHERLWLIRHPSP